MGGEQFSSDGGEATRIQTGLQQRNAAVQTMLTLALLIFGYLQVITPIARAGIFSSKNSILIFSVITFIAITTTTFTLIIGGKNMVDVIKKEFSN